VHVNGTNRPFRPEVAKENREAAAWLDLLVWMFRKS
jgi:hypothetical protein